MVRTKDVVALDVLSSHVVDAECHTQRSETDAKEKEPVPSSTCDFIESVLSCTTRHDAHWQPKPPACLQTEHYDDYPTAITI